MFVGCLVRCFGLQNELRQWHKCVCVGVSWQQPWITVSQSLRGCICKHSFDFILEVKLGLCFYCLFVWAQVEYLYTCYGTTKHTHTHIHTLMYIKVYSCNCQTSVQLLVQCHLQPPFSVESLQSHFYFIKGWVCVTQRFVFWYLTSNKGWDCLWCLPEFSSCWFILL